MLCMISSDIPETQNFVWDPLVIKNMWVQLTKLRTICNRGNTGPENTGSIVFNIITNKLDDGTEHTVNKFDSVKSADTVSKFAHNKKLGRVVDRDLRSRLDKSADKKVKKGKCEVLYLRKNSHVPQSQLTTVWKATLQRRTRQSWWPAI
ncbi:hypothetical protein llap_13636 [Limosa lapponica baueri]|uniref:Rna-directed dna polymerase from mobile element jockey-like n=1 Tax=Limosa lapponica baueri TaxID=1758121 RepID=A0A2I0TQG2_LIMLA|nr:hypothetical protein llap_13636 [Limosa lapponica baueri]